MFCKVLTNNPDLCHELLELIISKKVGKFTRLDKQKPIEITADGKGVRFDVYSEDDQNVVYDCEMQTSGNDNLPKRTRYYQGIHKDFFCAGGDADNVSPEMKDFLKSKMKLAR